METEKHLIWAGSLCIIILFLCLTLIHLNDNPYQVNFSISMDNNTYGVYKAAIYESTTSKDYYNKFDNSELTKKMIYNNLEDKCDFASDCFSNGTLKGCQKQGINWCCNNHCSLLATYP